MFERIMSSLTNKQNETPFAYNASEDNDDVLIHLEATKIKQEPIATPASQETRTVIVTQPPKAPVIKKQKTISLPKKESLLDALMLKMQHELANALPKSIHPHLSDLVVPLGFFSNAVKRHPERKATQKKKPLLLQSSEPIIATPINTAPTPVEPMMIEAPITPPIDTQSPDQIKAPSIACLLKIEPRILACALTASLCPLTLYLLYRLSCLAVPYSEQMKSCSVETLNLTMLATGSASLASAGLAFFGGIAEHKARYQEKQHITCNKKSR